ncbi:MAG TPA: type IV conjugative transfer system coupling protein TraD [Lacipirellula sp.]
MAPGIFGRVLRRSPGPIEDLSGDPSLHGVEPAEADVWIDIRDRVGHALVLGTTRVGKTRLAELLIAQDIRRGEVVIVFDPKGDLDLLRRTYAEAKRAGRLGQFFMFHLGYPELSARYNPVGSFSRITEVATRIAGQLPSEGQSAAFKEFVWRFVNVMARALVALGRKPDYEQINRYASNVEPLLIDYFEHWLDREPGASGWREEVDSMAIDKKSLDKGLQTRGVRAVTLVEYARRNKLYDPIAHALASTLNYEKSYFDKLVASLLPLMEKLTTGRTAALLSPTYDDMSDWRPVFDWTSVINLGAIVYIGLDALSDYEVAAAVGNSMFADLTSVAGSLYKFGTGHGLPGQTKPRRIAIHADEFNELIGEEFIPLLNKAGGAGFQVTAYTQTWSDVEARIGSRAKAGQIAGNFNSLIMLRVKEMATAKLLTDQLPEVRIVSTVVASSVSDTNDPGEFADFASRNEDRITTESAPMLSPSDLVQLPKGQAFALIHGGQLHKIRMPLPDGSHDSMMPQSLEAIGQELKMLAGGGDLPKPRAVTIEGKGIGF